MAILHATIPDDLQRQVQAVAKARGVPMRLLVEEALRCLVAPEPFANDTEAEAEIEALQADVLKGHPWEA
jgi:predicted transcriptional regulator